MSQRHRQGVPRPGLELFWKEEGTEGMANRGGTDAKAQRTGPLDQPSGAGEGWGGGWGRGRRLKAVRDSSRTRGIWGPHLMEL